MDLVFLLPLRSGLAFHRTPEYSICNILTMDHKKIKQYLLLVSVFVTGASVLIVEIVATRILSPFYGNTIYTTSSVIGIVLAALSFGYYLGGVLSDKYPYHRIFYSIIFISGLIIIFMQILGMVLLSPLSKLLTISSGPFISSLILFFIPAFFLGMLSPFAIRLNYKKDLNEVGKESGQVFFWSTLGSIAGSFLSGFVLIPYFGINAIIFSIGIFLVFWGIGSLIYHQVTSDDTLSLLSKKYLTIIILFFTIICIILWSLIPDYDSDIVYQNDGLYEKITIQDTQWNNQPARVLMLDRSHSSAMYLNSGELTFEYTKYYALYKLFISNPKTALFIGGGAYSTPRDMLQNDKNVHVDVIEIEPELFKLAKTYFNLSETQRLKNYVEDGRRFLTDYKDKYDIIVSDVYYSFWSIPSHFTTKEFFNLAKNRLTNNGVFIGNFAGSLNKDAPSFILSEIKTFKNIFPNSYFFALNSPNTEVPQNIIFLGIKDSKQIDFNSNLVKKNGNPIIKNLAEKNIDISNFDFEKHQEFTDNYSPTEYFTSRSISKWY